MAVITPALGAARTSLNKRFPSRDKASDGWIGDQAHQGSRSGHNPDETGNAEYTDSDNVDEVRAVDLDDDLRHPTLDMHDVVAAILRTPADLNRVSYLIYDRQIWSRSAGFKPRRYTGSNPHTSHLHISGRPTNDSDDRPWLSIERLGIPVEEPDVELSDKVNLWDESGDKPWWAGKYLGVTEDKPDKTVGQLLQYGGMVPFYVRDEVLPQLASIRTALAALAGQDLQGTIQAEFASMRTALLADLRDELRTAIGEELEDASEEQVERVMRRVFGSLDQAPAEPPPVQ